MPEIEKIESLIDPDPSDVRANMGNLIWWFENFFRIQPLDSASRNVLVPFKLNWTQRQVLREWLENPRLIVLKARQMGLTTLVVFYFLYLCMTKGNQTLYLWNFSAHMRTRTLARLRTSLKQLSPRWQQIFQVEFSNYEIRLKSLGGLPNVIYTSETPRSDALTGVAWSEVGYVCDRFPLRAQELQSAIYASAPYPLPLILETTPRSRRGFLYPQWVEGWDRQKRGERRQGQGFKFLFYAWYRKPENFVSAQDIPRDWVIDPEMASYFRLLEERDNVILVPGQRYWYERENRDAGSRNLFKREFPSTWEEGFEAATDGAFMAEHVERAQVEGRVGNYGVVRGQPVDIYFDIGHDNFTALTCVQMVNNRPTVVDAYRARGRQPPHFISWVWQWADKHDISRPMLKFPHDAKHNRFGMDNTIIEQFKRAYHANFVQDVKRGGQTKRDATNIAIPFCDSCHFNDTPGVQVLLESMRGVQYEFDKVNNIYNANGRLQPSDFNDSYDSFELAAVDIMRKMRPDVIQLTTGKNYVV